MILGNLVWKFLIAFQINFYFWDSGLKFFERISDQILFLDFSSEK
jgi:hypothetical protein